MSNEKTPEERAAHAHTLQEYFTYAAGGLAAAWFLPEIILTLDPFQYLLFKHAWVLGLPVILFAVLTFLQRRSSGRSRILNTLLSAVGALITVTAISMALFIVGMQPQFIAAIFLLCVFAFILSRSFSNWILDNVSEPMILAAIMLGLFMVFLGTGRVREVEKRDIALEELRAAGMDYNLSALQTTIFFLNDRGLGLYREAGFSEDDIEFALNQEHELTEGQPLIAGVIERLAETLEEVSDPSDAAAQTNIRSQQFGALFRTDRDASTETIRTALFQDKFEFTLPEASFDSEDSESDTGTKKGVRQRQSVVSHLLKRYAGNRLYLGLISNFNIGFYAEELPKLVSGDATAALAEEELLQQRKAFAASIDPFLPLLLDPDDHPQNSALVCRALSGLAWPTQRSNTILARTQYATASVAARLTGQKDWVAQPSTWRPIGAVGSALSELTSSDDESGRSIASCVAEVEQSFTPPEMVDYPNIAGVSHSGLTGFVIYKSPDFDDGPAACRTATFTALADEKAAGLYRVAADRPALAFTGLTGEIAGQPLIGALQESDSLGMRLLAMPMAEPGTEPDNRLAPFSVSWRPTSEPIGADWSQASSGLNQDAVVAPLGAVEESGSQSDPLSKHRTQSSRPGNATVRYQTVSVTYPDPESASDAASAPSDLCLEIVVSNGNEEIDRRGVYFEQDAPLQASLALKGGETLNLVTSTRSGLTLKAEPVIAITETPLRAFPPIGGAFRGTATAAIDNVISMDAGSKFSGAVGAEEQVFLAFEVQDLTQLELELTGLSSDIDVELLRVNDRAAFNEFASSTAGGSDDEQISEVLTAGTYLVRVYAYDGGSRFVLSLATDGQDIEEIGPISVSTPRASVTGRLSGDGTKTYLVTFDTAGTADFRLSGLAADVDIFVRDANGVELDSGINAGDVDELVFAAVEPGAYFVEVDPLSNVSPYQLDISLRSD